MNTTGLRKLQLIIFCLCLPALIVWTGCGKTAGSSTEANITLRFVVLGDSQGLLGTFPVNTVVLSSLINKVLALNPRPSFVLFLGDLVFSGGAGELNAWNQAVASLTNNGISIYPTIGNHDMADGYGDKQAAWRNNFSLPTNGPAGYDELAYSFERENALFACLDAFYYQNPNFYSYEITPDQQSWLSSLLSGSSKTFKFVFSHLPAFSPSGNSGLCLDTYPQKRDAFWKILDDNQVDLYFCGHEHLYARWTIGSTVSSAWHNNVVQITSGGAGGVLTPVTAGGNPQKIDSTFNYVVVDLMGNTLRLTAYDYQNNIIDTLTINK